MAHPGEYLPRRVLVHGRHYRGECRIAEFARWCDYGAGGVFVYMRRKFHDIFADTACHPEDDDGHDLFYPFEMADPPERERVLDGEFEEQRAWLARRAARP